MKTNATDCKDGKDGKNGKGDWFLTVDEVAKMIGVSRAWLYRQAKCGTIPHVRIGSVIRFSNSDISRWLESHKRGEIEAEVQAR